MTGRCPRGRCPMHGWARSPAAGPARVRTPSNRSAGKRPPGWRWRSAGSPPELKANKTHLTELVEEFVPGLLDTVGIGPVSGAQAIVSFSHVGRCRNEAAFAALAGASPIQASSGRTHRHRLNRGGDRQLNRALHDIAKTRWRHCERTKAYITRRQAEQMPDREIRRCLKRYIARELFRTLTAAGVDNT